MRAHRRARAALVVAALFSVLTLATGFPLATLLRQRAEIAGAVRELGREQSRNAQLGREVKSLSQRSTIVRFARDDYGLVFKGDRAYVILPGRNGGASMASLAPAKLPASDFVPPPATTWEVSSPPTAVPGAGFWGRVARHLEFWRGLF